MHGLSKIWKVRKKCISQSLNFIDISFMRNLKFLEKYNKMKGTVKWITYKPSMHVYTCSKENYTTSNIFIGHLLSFWRTCTFMRCPTTSKFRERSPSETPTIASLSGQPYFWITNWSSLKLTQSKWDGIKVWSS